MSSNQHRIIGTSEGALARAEEELGFSFPVSFRKWLLENNGKGIEDVTIFPVFDERDPRKTSDSIVRNFNLSWRSWIENHGGFDRFQSLLPFGEFGTGDFYCFDFSASTGKGEEPVVIWSHETGEIESVAPDFTEFAKMASEGELNY